MSSSFENEENLGVHPAGKPGDSEVAGDIFNLDLPTGRPSILRQSQFENVTNKTVPKGVKVCFQTPRRDPVTKRILSPSKTSKMNGLEECISNLESLKLTCPDESVSEKNSENEPVLLNSDTGGHGDVPIPPRGSYLLDLDNLDAINPFQSTVKMGFSPAKPCVGATVCRSPQIMGCLGDSKEVTSTASDPENVVEEAVKSDLALDETLPMVASLENSVDHGFAAVPSTDSPVIIDPLKLLVAQSEQSLNDDTEELPRALSPAVPEPAHIPESKSEPAPVCNSEEEAPLPARGAYSLDFDNLDSVNPFQTGGSKIPNSPAQGRKEETVKSSPPKQEHSLNEQTKVDECPVTVQPVAEAPAPVIMERKAAAVEEISASKELSSSELAPAADDGHAKLLEVNFGDDAEVTPTPPVIAEEDAPLPARGAYSLDFDNLDSVNPFQTGGSKMANSPALGKKEQTVKSSPLKQEHSLEEQTKVDDHPVTAQLIADTPTIPEDKPAVEETSVSKELTPLVNAEDDAPLSARGAYSFDFDNLDSVNPFQTGGSKIANSPAQGRKEQPVTSSPPKQDARGEQTKVDNPVSAHPIVEAPACTEDKPAVVKETLSSEPAPADDGQVKLLEFNFGDETTVKRKPPFKKLGKKPQGTKPSEKVAPTEKAAAPTENKPASPVEEPKPAAKTEPQKPTEVALPKGSYPVDFDKWDDPNFNPFGAKAAVGNSPAAERKNPVVAPAPPPSQKPVAKIDTVQKETDDHTSTMHAEVRMEDAENTTITVQQPMASRAPATCPSSSPPKRHMAPVQPEPTEMNQLQQNPNFSTAGGQEEEFVSGNAFMAGFDGQIDYLEQFGSSNFAESALRKQSLYLKFDPLLRESPKKGSGGNAMGVSLPRPSFATRLDAQKPADVKLSQGDSGKLLADLPAPDPTVLDLLVPTFKQPVKNDDASIIEVLKYSQKDMDAALARAREEAERNGDKIKAERDSLLEDKRQLGIALKEHDGLLEQILAEKEKEKQAILAELKKVQQEKDQALMDLNSMERSLSDLFKRLDKHKEVINGHKKDEETLKALVEEYASRIRQEGQRYKSLKAYAEEKISLANKEIAEVTAKNRSEVTGLQAQLKREQIRNQSLQMSLDQKIKDVEELNKVCEDLILNVQKN